MDDKTLKALHDVEEPILNNEEEELEEGVERMSEEELKQFKTETKKTVPKTTITKKPLIKKQRVKKPLKEKNIINKEKTLLYYYPTPEEWKQIHNLKPTRIIFYFTMTKHEYKELFLCQVKYQTKIIGSTGAREIKKKKLLTKKKNVNKKKEY